MDPDFFKWQLDLLLNGVENDATFVAVGWWPTWGQFFEFDTTPYPNGEHVLRLRIVREGANYDEYFMPIIINNG